MAVARPNADTATRELPTAASMGIPVAAPSIETNENPRASTQRELQQGKGFHVSWPLGSRRGGVSQARGKRGQVVTSLTGNGQHLLRRSAAATNLGEGP